MPDAAAPVADTVPVRYSIVGVQKAGTSTLSALLAEHPEIARSPKKELHFFDYADVDWRAPDYTGYVAQRRSEHERLAGDDSPSYFFHPQALRRMRRYHAGMRLVVLFRDPVERLFSHWTMDRERHDWFPDWPEFISRRRPRSLPARIPPGARPRRFIEQSGVGRGLYGQQLARGLSLFPREQWLLLDFRTMLADHEAALDRVTDHLGVSRFVDHPPLLHNRSGPASVPGTAPTAEDVAGLAEHYREDLAVFAELSGLDLSGWPTVQVLAGTRDPADLAADMARKVSAPDAPQ